MFDRFTERARKTMILARQAALGFHHDYIGTEHMLLGLVEEGSGVAAKVLRKLEVEPGKIRAEVEKIVKDGTNLIAMAQIPFTPRAKKVLELSLEEAQGLGHNYIGTEHLLLGLVREGEGIAARVLTGLGVKLDDVRRDVVATIADDEDSRAAAVLAADKDSRTLPPSIAPRKSLEPTVQTRRDASPSGPLPPSGLETFGRDLTQLGDDAGPDPSIGREGEIDRLVVALSGFTKASVLLVGPTGIGKTAIVDGLARRIADGEVPENLRGKRPVQIDVVRMLAGAEFRGQFEARIQSLLVETRLRHDAILVFDDLRLLIGTSSLLGERIDFATMLKSHLVDGSIRAIAMATPEIEASCRAADPGLLRHFRVLKVEPPSDDDALAILEAERTDHERHYNVRYADEVLAVVVELVRMYLPDRAVPDAVIDVLDEAGARARFDGQPPAPSNELKRAKLRDLEASKRTAIASQDFEAAATAHADATSLKREIESELAAWRAALFDQTRMVGEDAVVRAVSEMSGVDVELVRRRGSVDPA